jgi:hypothetical protein
MVSIAIDFAAAGSVAWTPLTCQVFGIGWARGASEDRGVMSVPEAGELVAYLVDPDRDLDPDNPASVFAGAIDIGAQLRVTMGGVVTFTGKIDQIAHDLEPPRARGADGIPLARIAVVDNLASAAAVSTPLTFPQETTAQRTARLLDGAAIATGSGQRDIEAGGQTLAAGGLVNDVWSDLLAVVQNELGSIDFRPDGKVVSRTRASTWATGTPTLHLGCDDPDHAALPLNAFRLMSERSTVRNSVDAARTGGTARSISHAGSIAKFGLRATSRRDLQFIDDASVDAWAAFLLNRSITPTRGFENVSVTTDNAGVAAINAVPLFTGRVHLYQDNYGNPIDRVLRLLGVAWDVDDQANATAQLVLGTDPGLISTLRRAEFDTQAQWVAGLGGASSGALGWTVDASGFLRTSIAGEYSASSGGLDALAITWRADL